MWPQIGAKAIELKAKARRSLLFVNKKKQKNFVN